MTRYVVGFEVAGLLLTAALVGAIALAHREEDEPDDAARGDRTGAADARRSTAPQRQAEPGLVGRRPALSGSTASSRVRPAVQSAVVRTRIQTSSLAPWVSDIPLNWFLYFAAASFAIGLVGVLVRRNAIAVLMAIEIMLNAANINLVAFWRYGTRRPGAGPARRGHAGPLRDHGRRGRGRRRHRPDPALLPPLARRRRRPLRQPVGMSRESTSCQ